MWSKRSCCISSVFVLVVLLAVTYVSHIGLLSSQVVWQQVCYSRTLYPIDLTRGAYCSATCHVIVLFLNLRQAESKMADVISLSDLPGTYIVYTSLDLPTYFGEHFLPYKCSLRQRMLARRFANESYLQTVKLYRGDNGDVDAKATAYPARKSRTRHYNFDRARCYFRSSLHM